ncbi:MAG: hypothetical protein RIM84_15635 [Alphaproteobacteria bacterium]
MDRNRMQMSHIYKPVMIQAVLSRGGTATRDEIAADFLARDVLQIEYYRRNVVNQMPGVRLVRDGVLVRQGDAHRLAEPFQDLTKAQKLELMAAREQRIKKHVAFYRDQFKSKSTGYEIPLRAARHRGLRAPP